MNTGHVNEILIVIPQFLRNPPHQLFEDCQLLVIKVTHLQLDLPELVRFLLALADPFVARQAEVRPQLVQQMIQVFEVVAGFSG